MKKTYINPITEEIQYDPSLPMLNGSLPMSDTETDTQFSRDDIFEWEDKDALDILLLN